MTEIVNTTNSIPVASSSGSNFIEFGRFLNLFKETLINTFSQRETLIALAIIAILLVVILLFKRFRESRKNSLTAKIKIELKNSCKQETPLLFLKDWFEQIYMPSWQSVITVFSLGTILFFLAHFDGFKLIFSSLAFQNNDHYQNLIAIHAGIGTIIFALLIFVAESLRDDETKDRARVLLRESFLFPLSVAEIVGFFIFIWGNVNIWAVIPLIIVAVLTIASLWRLLLVLLSKARFSKKRLQLLKDRIKKSINLAISERFGNNILLGSLGDGKIELKYYPFSLDDENASHHVFFADKTGVVTNIRLDKLDKFAKLVEKNANENGFSFYSDKVKPAASIASAGAGTSEGDVIKFTQCDRQYLGKRFKDSIGEDNQVLLAVDKRCVKDPEVLKELLVLSKEIFTVKKEENFSEEIKLEINGLTDQFIAAIEAKKLGRIEELSKTYSALADSFLEAINACGGGYTYEQARKERGAFFGGWNEVKWLSESIREILIKATQTNDREIIREVAYLPVHIATKAIKFGDQYVYQEFLAFPSLLYWLSDKKDVDVKELMIDRSWRHLKEMSDFYIEHQLKRKALDVKTIEKYKEYTIPIFSAFQNLLKVAFDRNNIKEFTEFLSKFASLYEDLEEDFRFPRAEHLKFDLERTSDPQIRADLEKKIEIQEARESAAKDIKEKKSQVVFGITAWILEQYRNKKENELLKNFYTESINRLPNSLPELTALFISSRTFETEHFWNWDNWELIPDGGVQSIDFHSKLDRLYCVRALNILANLSDADINAITLPHSRDLAFQADDNPNNRSLFNVLDAINANTAEWKFVLSDSAISKIPNLKELLRKARKAQENAEEKFLESVEMDEEKLSEFNKVIKDTFYKSSYIRPIIKKFGIYNDLTSEPANERGTSWGYNQVDRKEAFIKDWHVHYVGWGENYGSGMAHSEDEIIFEKLMSGIKNQQTTTKDNVFTDIERIVNSAKLENPVIIQTLDRMYEYTHVRRLELFVDQYRRDCPKTGLEGNHGYMGVLKFEKAVVPIVDLFVRKDALKNKVIIIDLAKFGELNQYSPIENEQDIRYKDDIFFIRVSDLNKEDEKRNKIISDNPAWLQEYSDKEAHLRRQVLVNIYERFSYDVKDQESSFCLSVTDLAASS